MKKPTATKRAMKARAPHNPFADGPPPGQGGAFIRAKDGKLVRDGDTEQHVPEGEDAGAPQQPSDPIVPPPPLGSDDAAGVTSQSQEG